MPKPIAVIPSRFAAQRFPGKPLALLHGTPMVEHVWRRCTEAKCFADVIVATDDPRIADVVKAFGGTVAMTSVACASGSDRIAEVARAMTSAPDDQVFFNVQGDEPAIHPQALATLAGVFDAPLDSARGERGAALGQGAGARQPSVEMATLIRPLQESERTNPNVVKVVLDASHHALYFSRADLPFARNAATNVARWAHLGIYAYRKSTLLRIAALSPNDLELTESLEQLRALANGVRIACRVTSHSSVAVDVPADVPAAEAALEAFRR